MIRNDQNITLEEAKYLAKKYYNYEQAVKVMLNSIYGAFGNQWFYFHNNFFPATPPTCLSSEVAFSCSTKSIISSCCWSSGSM